MNASYLKGSAGILACLLAAGSMGFAQGHMPRQTLLIEGDFAPAQFGSEVAMLGDLNGDGLADWMVGRRGKQGGKNFPELRILSGADGSQIHSLRGYGSIGRLFLEALVDLGDVDGDGVTDFAFGNANAPVNFAANVGRVGVFSGATGQTLYVIDGTLFFGGFGSSLAALGDVDGDGVSDLAIGQLGTLDENAYLVSGATGATLKKYKGPRNMGDIEFGYSAAAVGDVDGDMIPDFAMGTHSGDLVDYVSGATGKRIRRVTGATSFGRMLADLGDCDGDGFRDLLVGEPEVNSVSVLSGADGSVLRRITDSNGVAFGSCVGAAGDLNLDGYPDFLVGDPMYDSARGRVLAISFHSANLLYKLEGAQAGDMLGSSVAGGLDATGDGRPDFVVGSSGYDGVAGADTGAAALYSGKPILRSGNTVPDTRSYTLRGNTVPDTRSYTF